METWDATYHVSRDVARSAILRIAALTVVRMGWTASQSLLLKRNPIELLAQWHQSRIASANHEAPPNLLVVVASRIAVAFENRPWLFLACCGYERLSSKAIYTSLLQTVTPNALLERLRRNPTAF